MVVFGRLLSGRLVAKTLARQFMNEVDRACSPFQFALSTRAGVDCVGHAVRAATDADPRATVLSIDGIGAYDHVLRSAMMSKFLDVPGLQGHSYAAPSCYHWEDQDGSPQGVKILGTPVGHAEFVQAAMNARLEEEDKLWRALSWVPDLQCAWQLLVQCAGPRCHHLLRTMLPSQVVGYAAGHDEGMRPNLAHALLFARILGRRPLLFKPFFACV